VCVDWQTAVNMSATITGRIREINDRFRRTLIGGAIIVTAQFEELEAELKSDILWRIRNYDQFDDATDPTGNTRTATSTIEATTSWPKSTIGTWT
jgi:hypothetical protein